MKKVPQEIIDGLLAGTIVPVPIEATNDQIDAMVSAIEEVKTFSGSQFVMRAMLFIISYEKMIHSRPAKLCRENWPDAED